MKALYLINLFIACCSSFIIQPSYSLVKYNHYSTISSNLKINNKINKIELRKLSSYNNYNLDNDKNENFIKIIIKKILNFTIIYFLYYYIIIIVIIIMKLSIYI
jgi:hypothetical protein